MPMPWGQPKTIYSLVDRGMKQLTVRNTTPESQGNSQIKVITNWQYSEEVSHGFRRLMLLLLQERTGNGEKTTERECDRPGN